MGLASPAWAQADDERGLRAAEKITLEAKTEKRLALVIGNSDYKNSPLKNPVNDARAMGKALSGMGGFEVKVHENLDQKGMKRAIRDFGKALKDSGGVGLFYFAGHGMQVGGRNYLIPIGAQVDGEADVEIEGVDVATVLAKMEIAANRLNIVILDACRNNPFARSFRSVNQGLAFMDAPSGTLISYATAPGKVALDGQGDNGLFTAALLDELKVPGRQIEDVFKATRVAVRDHSEGQQVPWESSSLVGDFYFHPMDAGAGGDAEQCPAGTRKIEGECVAIRLECPEGTQFVAGQGCKPLDMADKGDKAPANAAQNAVQGQVVSADQVRARLKGAGWVIAGETSLSQLPNARSHSFTVHAKGDPSRMAAVVVLDFDRENIARTYAGSFGMSQTNMAYQSGKKVIAVQSTDQVLSAELIGLLRGAAGK